MAEYSVHQIEELRGFENYPVWKMRMTDILAATDLIDYALGATAKPSEVALQAALAHTEDENKARAAFDASAYATKDTEWMINDRKALSSIRFRVSNDLLVYVRDARSAKEIWDILEKL